MLEPTHRIWNRIALAAGLVMAFGLCVELYSIERRLSHIDQALHANGTALRPATALPPPVNAPPTISSPPPLPPVSAPAAPFPVPPPALPVGPAPLPGSGRETAIAKPPAFGPQPRLAALRQFVKTHHLTGSWPRIVAINQHWLANLSAAPPASALLDSQARERQASLRAIMPDKTVEELQSLEKQLPGDHLRKAGKSGTTYEGVNYD